MDAETVAGQGSLNEESGIPFPREGMETPLLQLKQTKLESFESGNAFPREGTRTYKTDMFGSSLLAKM